MMKPKRNCIKVIRKENKQFVQILVMKWKKNYVKATRTENKQKF